MPKQAEESGFEAYVSNVGSSIGSSSDPIDSFRVFWARGRRNESSDPSSLISGASAGEGRFRDGEHG